MSLGGHVRGREREVEERDIPDTVQVAFTKPSLQAYTRLMRVLYVSSVHGMGSRSWEDSPGVMMEEQ